MTPGAGIAVFEAERPRLQRLAYRMLGSVTEAQDVVQDAWLRWCGVDDVANPSAWLVRATTRLCIDRMRAERARRETYVGPWLPEPLIEPPMDDPVERADEVSVAFLLALERLSPLERAVFLLHDVFDQDYGQIALTLDRSEAACRQLAARGREHVRAARPRFTVAEDQARRITGAFLAAAATGDVAGLAALLAEDAVLLTDGGGKRSAALNPIFGRDKIMRFVIGIMKKGAFPAGTRFEPARINGLPGLVITDPQDVQTAAFEIGEDGLLTTVYMVRNPDKLRHLRTT
jgi:RNA polymerase sigma-70 factor (ECF subfamily)